jgi:flagellar hook-length control protein FliK
VAADGQAAVGLKAGSVLGSAAGEGGRPGASEASRGRTREGLAKAGSASAASAASAREAGIAEGASAAQGQPGAPGSTGTGTATGSNTLGTATSANGSPPTSAAPGAGTQTGSAQAAPSAAFPLGAHGLVAASPQAGATSTAAAAPPLFALSPALDSPTFAPALGLQLSVLARDGIEQARIQLNPEALGPVAVQLSMAGQQIELEFVAAHARTREALEQALPQLASALGDAGFTMTGGGVFQQPRNGRDPRSPEPELPGTNRSSSGPAEHGASGEPAVSGLRPAAAPRGLVDLYA